MIQQLQRRSFLFSAAIAASAAGLATVSKAQGTYPDRPIRILIGTPPGDTADGWTRQVAHGMSSLLGQSIVIDNKPGAHGMIVGSAAKSAPRMVCITRPAMCLQFES